MKIFHRKSFVLLAILIASIAVLISWSQTWFTIQGEITHSLPQLEVSGQTAASALAALAVLGFAILAALSLARRVLQKILAIVIALLGFSVLYIVSMALTSPVSASLPALSGASGLIDLSTMESQIQTLTVSLWPFVALGAGALYLICGIATLAYSTRWKAQSTKYESTSVTTSVSRKSDTKVDQWDAMSAGDDPTLD